MIPRPFVVLRAGAARASYGPPVPVPHQHGNPAMTLAPSDDARRYAVFDLSGRTLALPASSVLRFLPVPALERPPAMPPVLAGVFRLHGQVVPVLRLDRLLGLEETPIGLYTPLLLLDRGDGPLAVAAQCVHGIVAAPESHEIAEDLSFDGCALAMIPFAGRSAVVLDPTRLLTTAEERLLETFRSQAEERLAQWQAP